MLLNSFILGTDFYNLLDTEESFYMMLTEISLQVRFLRRGNFHNYYGKAITKRRKRGRMTSKHYTETDY